MNYWLLTLKSLIMKKRELKKLSLNKNLFQTFKKRII